jgi:hypothetical protein
MAAAAAAAAVVVVVVLGVPVAVFVDLFPWA